MPGPTSEQVLHLVGSVQALHVLVLPVTDKKLPSLQVVHWSAPVHTLQLLLVQPSQDARVEPEAALRYFPSSHEAQTPVVPVVGKVQVLQAHVIEQTWLPDAG